VQRALSPDAEEARWTAALCRKHERAVRAALADLTCCRTAMPASGEAP